MVPVLAIGFSDLQKRKEQQAMYAKMHLDKLDEMQSRLKKLSSDRRMQTEASIQDYKRRHLLIERRVMEMMLKLFHLVAKNQSLSSAEEQLSSSIEQLASSMAQPAQFRQRVHELQAMMQRLNDHRTTNQVNTAHSNWTAAERTLEQHMKALHVISAKVEEEAALVHVMEKM
jgi:nuclear pore complex protein Nup54